MRHLKLVLILAVIAIFAIIGVVLFQTKKVNEKIIIADAQQPVFALVYVADKKGYFKDEGLDISYTKFYFGKDGLADVTKGNSDIATVYESPVVRKVYEGENLSAVSTLHISNRNTAVIGLKERGINEASDLRGKNIAVPRGTNAEIFLYSLLLINDIDSSEVNVVDMLPEKMVQALRDGSIDGVSLFNPYLDKVEHEFKSEETSVIFSNTYTEMSLLVGKRDYVLKNPDKIIRLLSAIVKAEDYTNNHQAEAIKIVNEWLPNYTETEITRQWPAFRKTAVLNNTLLTILVREAQFYKDAGFYTKPVPSFRELIFTDYLKQVRPEAVTIY
jgi:ABC-type nitrate/sulfonate/bicarbonate transport system substrate-binding protein